MRTVAVISAGLSNPSTTKALADQLSGAVTAAVTARGESVDITHIELRNLAADLATAMTTGGMLTPALSDAQSAIERADGIIAVTPVFSASYSGLFKMFFDALDKDAVKNKPAIIAATAGTARHSLVLEYALRPLFSYLRANIVPTGVFAATEDFGGEYGTELSERVVKAAQEFAPLILGEQLAVGGLGGVTAQTTPQRRENNNFESLLKQHLG